MNTANLELCKELYELSAWEEEGAELWCLAIRGDEKFAPALPHFIGSFPSYSLGFLLRNLPAYLDERKYASLGSINLDVVDNRMWACGYGVMAPAVLKQYADTPEDAVCKLAIELFKQGVLKK